MFDVTCLGPVLSLVYDFYVEPGHGLLEHAVVQRLTRVVDFSAVGRRAAAASQELRASPSPVFTGVSVSCMGRRPREGWRRERS